MSNMMILHTIVLLCVFKLSLSEEWNEFFRGREFFFDSGANYHDVNDRLCRYQFMETGILHTKDELDFILGFLKTHSGIGNIGIGMKCSNGSFVWNDGREVSFGIWSQENICPDSSKRVSISSSGKYTIESRTAKNGIFCTTISQGSNNPIASLFNTSMNTFGAGLKQGINGIIQNQSLQVRNDFDTFGSLFRKGIEFLRNQSSDVAEGIDSSLGIFSSQSMERMKTMMKNQSSVIQNNFDTFQNGMKIILQDQASDMEKNIDKSMNIFNSNIINRINYVLKNGSIDTRNDLREQNSGLYRSVANAMQSQSSDIRNNLNIFSSGMQKEVKNVIQNQSSLLDQEFSSFRQSSEILISNLTSYFKSQSDYNEEVMKNATGMMITSVEVYDRIESLQNLMVYFFCAILVSIIILFLSSLITKCGKKKDIDDSKSEKEKSVHYNKQNEEAKVYTEVVVQRP